MLRSYAPSQIGKSRQIIESSSSGGCNTDDDDITIKRMPLFGFLEIPESLHKQFVIPGAKITRKSIELRKVKVLGGFKPFRSLKPSDLAGGFKPAQQLLPTQEDNGNEEEDFDSIPTSLPPFEHLVLWKDEASGRKIEVIPALACKLRPHQREGVQFLFECTMGLRGFEGNGCILADDMGLGKTLMSITLLWTLLNQSMASDDKEQSIARKVVIVCPTSLVGNWNNELRKWIGEHCPTFPASTDPKSVIKRFVGHRGKAVLIVSYESQRRYAKMFEITKANPRSSCDLLICDEAHKLKNADSGLSKSLNSIPVRRRILLSGTPMQNDLGEFFNMVSFCNPGVLGSIADFRKKYERPILNSREPGASDAQIESADRLQKELSTIVNEFILKRGNILNAQHLPPKLVQVVCCRLSSEQERIYDTLLESKEIRDIRDGKMLNTLNTIRLMINLCSHPRMIIDSYRAKLEANEDVSEELVSVARLVIEMGIACTSATSVSSSGPTNNGLSAMSKNKSFPAITAGAKSRSSCNRAASSAVVQKARPAHYPALPSSYNEYVDINLSGKLRVLHRLMQSLRAAAATTKTNGLGFGGANTGERIVVVSNYTQTLDLIEKMCEQNRWPCLRLDGSIGINKRTSLVDEFNNPHKPAFAFLLSSKAGGCGINLIGASRLVLFDPDWNPASDKQAAGRIWREGQKRRCYIYKFMSTGTIEEKIIQRQLSKEGLQDIVDDKEQVNQFSTEDLRQLFVVRYGDTVSDTHDTLACKRCKFVAQKFIPGLANKSSSINAQQVEACSAFISQFVRSLSLSLSSCKESLGETLAAEVECKLADISFVVEELNKGSFKSIPQFSRRLRAVITGVERDIRVESETSPALTQFLSSANIEEAFVEGWGAVALSVSRLRHRSGDRSASSAVAFSRRSSLSSSISDHGAAIDAESAGEQSGDDDDSDDDIVEQEGCPDETDLNKWSHHRGVETCDDDILKRAMADDDTVSFVFGLEVNWSLLISSEEAKREEREAKKAQQAKDLEELNAKRIAERNAALKKNSDQTIDDDHETEKTTATKRHGRRISRDNPDAAAILQNCQTDPVTRASRTTSRKINPRTSHDIVDDSDSEIFDTSSGPSQQISAIELEVGGLDDDPDEQRNREGSQDQVEYGDGEELGDVEMGEVTLVLPAARTVSKAATASAAFLPLEDFDFEDEADAVGAPRPRRLSVNKDSTETFRRRRPSSSIESDEESSKENRIKGIAANVKPNLPSSKKSRRDSQISSASPSPRNYGAGDDPGAIVEAVWSCAKCTYMNETEVNTFVCAMCDGKRPADKRRGGRARL